MSDSSALICINSCRGGHDVFGQFAGQSRHPNGPSRARSFGPRVAHLRKILPKSALSKVTAELAQDLVKTPHSELSRKLKDVLKG
jgi:hypothetical protein